MRQDVKTNVLRFPKKKQTYVFIPIIFHHVIFYKLYLQPVERWWIIGSLLGTLPRAAFSF